MRVYDFDNYLEILKNFFDSDAPRSGLKSRFAQACGMQTSYLSQILAGRTQLSGEQALKAAQFLNLNHTETEYFLLAVHKARAGTQDLADFYTHQLQSIKAEQDQLAQRLDETSKLSPEATQVYYSTWLYSALHVIFSLPTVTSIEDAALALKVDTESIAEVSQFLETEGLIERSGSGYQTRPANIHLPNQSPLIQQHHTNWRLKALDSVQNSKKQDLHYSVAFTLSKADAEKLRENLMQVIRDNLKTVGPSKEEVMYATTIDFFRLA